MKQTLNFALVLSFLLTACSSTTATPLISTVTSIPLEPTLTETVTPIPSETPIPTLESLPITQESVSQFASAMQKAGINITAEQILQKGLLIQTIAGADGKQYEIAMANLDPDPNQAGENWEGNYPLMIKMNDGWAEITFKNSETISHFAIGTSIDGWEGSETNKQYRETALKYFSVIYLDGQIIPQNTTTNWNSGKNAFELAKNNNLILYLHPGFYPAAETENIKGGSPDEIKKYVDGRIDHLLNLVNPTGTQITFLNFVNEASWTYKGNVGLFKDTDVPSNPFYKAYGKDWVSELYVLIYNKAQERNIIIGKDLVLVDNESGMYFSGKKVALMKPYLLKQKELISQKLNIPIGEVNLGVGMQLHMSPTPDNGNYFYIPTDTEFLDALNQMSEVGDVFLTEFDVKGVSPDEQVKTLIHFMLLAKQSGQVREMDFYHTLRFVKPYDPNNAFENGANGLFNKDFTPSNLYYEFLKALYQN